MHHHRSCLVRLNPVPHHRTHPPSELQHGVAKRTSVTVPFGEMELQYKSLFNYLLQNQRLYKTRNENKRKTYIQFFLAQSKSTYVKIGQFLLLNDAYSNSAVRLF